MSKTGWILAVAASLVTIVLTAPSAMAGDTNCTGSLIGGTYDNVIVPPNRSCTLSGATVRGTVKALENARLFAANNTVRGNIIGDKAEVMDLRSNTLDGSIDVKEGETDDPGGVDDVQVFRNNVRYGDIKVEKMAGEIEVGVSRDPSLGNLVPQGNIFLQENRPVPQPGFFGFEVSSNTVGENLQVFKTFGNAPRRSSTTALARICSARRTPRRSRALATPSAEMPRISAVSEALTGHVR